METSRHSNNTSKFLVVLVAAVAVLVLLGALLVMAKNKGGLGDSGVKKDQYQAVFLTNGQVYFGKLADVGRQYVKLTNIYYLQVQQNVQPADAQQQQQNKDQAQVSLAKLGSELHGPEDTMFISRDQVLFWENLKNDGKVAEAIKTNK